MGARGCTTRRGYGCCSMYEGCTRVRMGCTAGSGCDCRHPDRPLGAPAISPRVDGAARRVAARVGVGVVCSWAGTGMDGNRVDGLECTRKCGGVGDGHHNDT